MYKMETKKESITLKNVLETVSMAQSRGLTEFVIELNKHNCSMNHDEFIGSIRKAYKHDALFPYGIDQMSWDGFTHVRFYMAGKRKA